jgi:hypothetical protein
MRIVTAAIGEVGDATLPNLSQQLATQASP